jgi:hypothetical protein
MTIVVKKTKIQLPKKHLTWKDTQTGSERMKIIFQINGIWKQAGGAILIPDKIDFKAKLEEVRS